MIIPLIVQIYMCLGSPLDITNCIKASTNGRPLMTCFQSRSSSLLCVYFLYVLFILYSFLGFFFFFFIMFSKTSELFLYSKKRDLIIGLSEFLRNKKRHVCKVFGVYALQSDPKKCNHILSPSNPCIYRCGFFQLWWATDS